MVLAAWELGIGSVPATVFEDDLIRRLLGLPAGQHGPPQSKSRAGIVRGAKRRRVLMPFAALVELTGPTPVCSQHEALIVFWP
jgi:nitroreductase